MGRDKTTDSEKRLKGTLRPDRADNEVNDGAATPLTRMPNVPEWIGDEGQKLWREQGRNLIGKKLLSEDDIPAFARYCQFAGMFERLMGEVNKEGYTVELPNGIETPNPKFKMALDCQNQADKLGRQFGFTPATRKNVPKVADPEKYDDPLEELLFGHLDNPKRRAN